MKITSSNSTEWLAAIAAVTSGLLLFAAFPPLEWTWAAWLAWVPVGVLARRSSWRVTLKMGFAGGFLFWLLSLNWLTNVTVLGWIAISAYCTLFMLPVLVATHWWRGGALGFATLLAVVWSGCDFFRGWLFGGFPWNPLGVAVTPWLPAIQLAEFGGVWVVTGLVAFVNALGIWAVTERRGWVSWGTGVCLVAVALGWGAWRQTHLPPLDRTLRVALVQTSIPQDEKWVTEKILTIYERLATLTRRAQSDPRVDLVIWPETALPDDLRNSEYSHELVWRLCTNGTPILTGSLDTAVPSAAAMPPLYFNSAFLVNVEGNIAGEYDKRNLVIGGEYIPLARFVPEAWQLAWGWPATITAGKKGSVFRTGKESVPLSPLICFEDIFPALARDDVRAGSRMLVNLTNDAWFDASVAPRQHMRNSVLRTVENRVPLVRAANTGVTCIIEPSGKIAAQWVDAGGRTDTPGVLWTDVSVPADSNPLTFYARYGDMYGLACVAIAVLWFATSIPWRRKTNLGNLKSTL